MFTGSNSSNSRTALSDGSFVTQISSTMQKWVEDFSYGQAFTAGTNSINALTGPAGDWDIARNFGGMSVTVNNGNMVVGMGTVSGAELLMIGRTNATIPANLIVSMIMSQRTAGNEVRLGYLEVDESGAMIANTNLAGWSRNATSILLSGTDTANTGRCESVATHQAAVRSIAFSLANGSTTMNDYSIECRPEDVTAASQTADSAGLKSGNSARISSVVPQPGGVYRPFLWLRNTSTPASSTNVTFYRVVSMDLQELQAEIGGGRGNYASSQAIPAAIVNTLQVSNATVGTGSNGASTHKLTSAATTNLATLKASSGRIYSGIATNVGNNIRYLKLFNKASAPVLGTDVPVLSIPLLPNLHTNLAMIAGPMYGLYFGSGISYAITAGDADTDATAITANEIYINMVYA